jgi:hexosaminidase
MQLPSRRFANLARREPFRRADNAWPMYHLLPAPLLVAAVACASARLPQSVGRSFDAAALASINERWSALGMPALRRADRPDVVVRRATVPSQAYRLTVRDGHALIESSDAAGAFYGAMTLAQLPQPFETHASRAPQGRLRWRMPCVRIEDRPALRWRILSDDVSRGPLPTMRYFKERIRTIAAFKMNGYSPYMEHVFVSPTDPLPAPLDGITPAQLRELAIYAKRYHVAFIPEQQSFAHMHNTLRYETYAGAAELPHGFLLSPNVPLSMEYLSRVVSQELQAVPHPPFFHIGSDETSTLGLGQTAGIVAQRGRSQVYADHIIAMARLIAPSGARIMLWDDGIEADPGIMRLLPKGAVIINWHYNSARTFVPYINLIASGGFQQMVAPGANNWNEVFPDLNTAIPNENRFISEGKAAHVLGLFQTVWHDDGTSLYEDTWYPVLYAAASAWESRPVDPQRFQHDFAPAFFGSDDARFGGDVRALADALTQLESTGGPYTNYLLWADPFDSSVAKRMLPDTLRRVRLEAEGVQAHLLTSRPPLHRAAARAMFLAARTYDVLARRYQIASEVATYYADAVAQAGGTDSPTVRDLYWCKYWFWEQRDMDEELAGLYAQAWNYESRSGHLAGNLQRYHLDAQRAIARADAINRTIYEVYVPTHTLPPLDSVLSLPKGDGTKP